MDNLLELIRSEMSKDSYFHLFHFLMNEVPKFVYRGVELPGVFCIAFDGSLNDNIRQIRALAFPKKEKAITLTNDDIFSERMDPSHDHWTIYDLLRSMYGKYGQNFPFPTTKRLLAGIQPYYTDKPDRLNVIIDHLMLKSYFDEYKATIFADDRNQTRIEIGNFRSKCAPLSGTLAASLVATLPENHIVVPFNYRGDYANPYLVSLLEEYSGNKQGFLLESHAAKEISVNVPIIKYRKKNGVVMIITNDMIIKHFATADMKTQRHPFFNYRTTGGLERKQHIAEAEDIHFIISINHLFNYEEEYYEIFKMSPEQRIAYRDKHNIAKIVDDGDEASITTQLFHLMYKLFLNYDCYVCSSYRDLYLFNSFAGFCNYTREEPAKKMSAIYYANTEDNVVPYEKGFFDGIRKNAIESTWREMKFYRETEADQFGDQPRDMNFVTERTVDQMAIRDFANNNVGTTTQFGAQGTFVPPVTQFGAQKPLSPPVAQFGAQKPVLPSVAQFGAPVAQFGSPVAQFVAPVAQKPLSPPVTQFVAPVTQFGAPVAQKPLSPPVTQFGSPVTQFGSPVTQFGSPVTQFGSPVTQKPLSPPVTQFGSPVAQKPLSPPVTQFVAPVTQKPLSPPVTQFVAPVTQKPLSPPVTQKPLSPPVTQFVAPVTQFVAPVTQFGAQKPLSPPVTQFVAPAAQKPLSPPVTQFVAQKPLSPPVTQFVAPAAQKPLSPPVTQFVAPVTQFIPTSPTNQTFVPIFAPVKPQTYQPMFQPIKPQTYQPMFNYPN